MNNRRVWSRRNNTLVFIRVPLSHPALFYDPFARTDRNAAPTARAHEVTPAGCSADG